jgi:hypothetical protein
MNDRLSGMAEAERQLLVAQRLYAATQPKVTWDRLGLAARRPFIDQACQPPHNKAAE